LKTVVQKLPLAARLVLGLIFFVFGLNGFLHFLPQPPLTGPPGAFLGALAASGYLLSLLSATQVLTGALLLSGFFVPLALTLLAPVIVNIVAFHLFLSPGNYVVVGVVLISEFFLAWSYRAAFVSMLRPRTEPQIPIPHLAPVGRELHHAAAA
jgi:putative oxidoreductase